MPKEEPENDLCRCCHAEGAFKNLYETYSWMDVEDVVYSQMLQECFEVEMAPVTPSLQHMLCAICETCIERLHDAVKFKRQVLKCEKRFRDVYGSCVGGPTFEVKIKQEKIDDVKDDSFNGENSKMSAVAESFRMMDEDDDDEDDDDGFGDRDDDDFKQTDDVKVKKEIEESDSDDNMSLQQVSKGKKRKGAPSAAASKKKIKGAARAGGVEKTTEKTADGEEIEVVQGMTVIRLKSDPIRKNIDFKTIGDVHQCLRCPAVYTSVTGVDHHIKRIHFNTDNWKCPHCSEKFIYLSSLRTHKLSKHKIDNRFKCKACDRVFIQKRSLDIHMNSFHMLGEKIKCTECDYESRTPFNVNNHMKCHSTERDFQCQYCKKTFKRKKTLLIHERIHTGDRRKVCAECGQAFVQRASLKYHMEKHHTGVDH